MARYRWIKGRGMVPANEAACAAGALSQGLRGDFPTPMIMESRHYDYDSIVTGERITSRGEHREHLARHGMEEVGSEKPKWMRNRDEMRAEGIEPPDPADAAHARAAKEAADVPVLED